MEDNKKKFMEWLKNVPKWPLRYNRGEVHPLTDNKKEEYQKLMDKFPEERNIEYPMVYSDWEEKFNKAKREREWINTGKWPTEPSDTPHIARTEWATEEEKAKMYPDEISKPVQTIEEWEKLSMEEKFQDTQRVIDSMRNNPDRWKDGPSAIVNTTEEQREVLRKIQSEYGHKVIKNEQSGKEQSLEEKMKVLQGIKTTKVSDKEDPEDYNTSITHLEILKDSIEEQLSKLPAEMQVEIAKKVLLNNPAYKQYEKALDMITEIANTPVQVNYPTEPTTGGPLNWTPEQGTATQANYMQVIPDSQGYSALEQILESLKYLSWGYEVKPVPEEGIHINWPPISIEYMIKGIENTIAADYQLKQQDNGTEDK